MEVERGFTHNHNNKKNNSNGIYIGISPQHMEFKATNITKLDAIYELNGCWPTRRVRDLGLAMIHTRNFRFWV